jgi:hypothetical protein
LHELVSQGYALRTRALLTAMFARVVLGNLFLHGIGGAKYDEVTDEIIRRFFGFEPPRFQVLSGTLRLPLPAFSVTSREYKELELRDLWFNPQRHLECARRTEKLQQLTQEKLAWIAGCAAGNVNRHDCHIALKSLNRQMAPFFAEARNRLKDEIQRRGHELKANAVLQRRDYAFCLFPEEMLRPFCSQFL